MLIYKYLFLVFYKYYFRIGSNIYHIFDLIYIIHIFIRNINFFYKLIQVLTTFVLYHKLKLEKKFHQNYYNIYVIK